MSINSYRKFFIFLSILIFLGFVKNLDSNEIVQDKNGNYFLIKKDGTYKKLPPPKPGHKYILKKKEKYYNVKDKYQTIKKKKKMDTRTAKTQNQKGNRDLK